ncbi:peptidoglycan recognition protein family protein [Saccharopolyspora phatthalungensis]|uniref:Uncharacterized protein with LGFP repeats n=1 Tax=Saccharopolyspora phatthalungensis TaxID=664693 RepID=A0A840Q1B1_9PSEU|nr:N-acetylmuramoyl-L-alanine amidase [Saccharopolyspora phatthalungensis]MBB5154164.1 uncharacterized protein with LGFP repeats [Saccharopolyspora phatthalungensis]
MRLRLSVAIALLLTATALPAASAAVSPETTSTRIALRDTPQDRDFTREARSDSAFELVGITWRGPAPDSIQVRTRNAAGWGEWTELEAIDSAQGSEPLWTGRTYIAQVRAFRAGADVTGDLDLVAINPGSAPATPPRSSIPGAPPVVGRAQWGADENLMTWPPEPTETRAITVHHTAGTNDYNCRRSADIVRAIYRYHAVELKWGDIGYHALVDKCGTIFEGRAGGLRNDVIGGHARGFNHNTFGVAMMGNYDRVLPSRATIESVAETSAWKLGTRGVPVDGHAQLIAGPANNSHFPADTPVRLPTIFGHRDVSKTLCPGQRGYEQLAAIRARAATLQRAHQP